MDQDTLYDIENALRFGLGRDDLADAFMSSLDAAWAEAEAALPDGWRIRYVTSTDADNAGWETEACDDEAWCVEPGGRVGEHALGPTPAAALRGLAAKLRERVDLPSD